MKTFDVTRRPLYFFSILKTYVILNIVIFVQQMTIDFHGFIIITY